MKIISRIVAAGLAVSLNMPRKVEAVPIVIAPLVCAKVCVLVGTAVVGGVTAYVWQHTQTKKKYLSTIKGELIVNYNNIKSVRAKNMGEAIERCLKLKPANKRLVKVSRIEDVTGGSLL